MSVASAIYRGHVTHVRLRPVRHRLDYRVFSILVDVDELPDLDCRTRLFGYNRAALVSFHDKDHGTGTGAPLRPWVEAQLREAGVTDDIEHIRILCYPRIFGYVFNPLSVYFCQSSDGRTVATLYEVGNTFAERHVYVMPVDDNDAPFIRQSCEKIFYVSPFMPMSCFYDFRVHTPGERISVAINEADAEGPLLMASFVGRHRPFSGPELLRAWLTHPLMTVKVIAAIHWEALRLWFKGAPIHRHTPARSKIAISVPPPQGILRRESR